MSSIISPLARTGLYYHSLVMGLYDVIRQKDTHIVALQDKLKDLGGAYFPRKYKDALDQFDGTKWRVEQRQVISEEGESAMGVFERWEQVGEEERLDWEAVVKGLGEWSQSTSQKVCFKPVGGGC